MCSVLLQHTVPVLIIPQYPLDEKQRCEEVVRVVSTVDVESRLEMGGQGT